MTTFDCSPKVMLRKHLATGPICHVGSLFNAEKATQDDVDRHRKAFSQFGGDFVGVDLFPGLNVDVVGDLTGKDFFSLHPRLEGYFGIVLCSALLEHVKNPFDAAGNITRMLRPGGHLFFTGPWVWGFHPYPSDYWRISYEGLKVLFPAVQFVDWWYSGTLKNKCVRLDKDRERSLFRSEIDGLVSDRAMSYLNVGAIGRRLEVDG